VFNKLDALEPGQLPRVPGDLYALEPGRTVPRWFVSARTGDGLVALRRAIADAALSQERQADSDRPDPRFDPERGETDDTMPERVESLHMPSAA
jgi:GTP-binding protein HflX